MAMHFDLWERDPFFSAAEEVQESADRMESTYRTWIHALKDNSNGWNPEELRRDLHTALGTTKWQLEEFERAVRSSYKRNSADEAKDRHHQFVLAMEDKISLVGKSLQESSVSEGKPSTPWVRLDEGERDELAMFLAGPPVSGDNIDIKVVGRDEKTGFLQETDREAKSEQQVLEGKDGKSSFHRRTASASADLSSWHVMVLDDKFTHGLSTEKVEAPPRRVPSFSAFIGTMESASKLYLPKNGFRKWKASDRQQDDDAALLRPQQLSGGLNACCERSKSCIDNGDECYDKQLYGWYGGIQRLLQRSQYQMQYSRSMQVTIWTLLLLFSVVLFVLRAI